MVFWTLFKNVFLHDTKSIEIQYAVQIECNTITRGRKEI